MLAVPASLHLLSKLVFSTCFSQKGNLELLVNTWRLWLTKQHHYSCSLLVLSLPSPPFWHFLYFFCSFSHKISHLPALSFCQIYTPSPERQSSEIRRIFNPNSLVLFRLFCHLKQIKPQKCVRFSVHVILLLILQQAGPKCVKPAGAFDLCLLSGGFYHIVCRCNQCLCFLPWPCMTVCKCFVCVCVDRVFTDRRLNPGKAGAGIIKPIA